MGARLLKKWILEPLFNIDRIKIRQSAVRFFYENYDLLTDFREILGTFYDLERILGRINCNINIPRDLIALKNFLGALPNLKSLIQNKLEFYKQKRKIDSSKDEKDFLLDLNLDIKKTNDEIFFKKLDNFLKYIDSDNIKNLYSLIDKTIVDNPPNNLKDGSFIKPNFSEELDRLRNIKKEGRNILLDYEQEEKNRTKISTLKIKFNNIFGYFFETTKLYKDIIPNDFMRIQSLSNCERFTSEKLKKYEIDLLEAENKSIELEIDVYNFVRKKIQEKENIIILQKIISFLAKLDVFSNFAFISLDRNYNMPEITDDYDLVIKNGRHPILEVVSKDSLRFVPNDTNFLEGDCHFYLITGPNMAGKSTYIRQIALIVLMAQIGCPVPADEAKIGLVDKIFTRIGSGDKLVKGESTFFVEMKEAVEIVKESTEKSLVILDEIGRGTSTFDGISIAWAIATELIQRDWINTSFIISHNNEIGKNENGPRTLFATHYFELIELLKNYKVVKNFNLLIEENNENIVFLHKVVEGNTNKSYGIYVAKLAGLPFPLIEKAKQKLKDLEKITENNLLDDNKYVKKKTFYENKIENEAESEKTSFFENRDEVINEIKQIKLDEMSPIYAILKIKEWQDKLL
jgi:DNA mismatch repair protein MutS